MTGHASRKKEEGNDGIRVSLEERRWFIRSGGCHVGNLHPLTVSCSLGFSEAGSKTKTNRSVFEAKLLEDSVLTQTRMSPTLSAPFTGS